MLRCVDKFVMWTGRVFDSIVEYSRDELIPTIKNNIDNFVGWIREKISSNQVHATTSADVAGVAVAVNS